MHISQVFASILLSIALILSSFTNTVRHWISATPLFAEIVQATPTEMPHITYTAPTPAIAALADQATMTDNAKQIFYAARPQIDTDRQTFENDCQTPVVANTVELGCYTPNNRIFILNINNTQLQNEMVVVAAHEMLHAAYAMLPPTNRDQIDAQLEADVPVLEDTALHRELLSYKETEPGERDNELHSLLGTEYTPLSPSLETYYQQYFTQRSVVVGYAQAFDKTFSGLETAINGMKQQLTALQNLMQADLQHGDTAAYNSRVPHYNMLVREYNADVDEYNSLSRSLLQQAAPQQP